MTAGASSGNPQSYPFFVGHICYAISHNPAFLIIQPRSYCTHFPGACQAEFVVGCGLAFQRPSVLATAQPDQVIIQVRGT